VVLFGSRARSDAHEDSESIIRCSSPRTLSAFSLPSFAGGIASVASGLPLGFYGGIPRCLLSEFRITGLLFGLQRGLTSGNLGDLRSG